MSPFQSGNCVLAAGSGGGSRGSISAIVEQREMYPTYTGENPNAIASHLKLYGRCSQHYLQIYYNIVNTNGKLDSPLVDLRVQSDGFGSRIRIQSRKFGKFLCFNKRKRIAIRYNGKSRRCVFVERMNSEGYTELESDWRPGMFLGFNRKGKFINPHRYHNKRKCFQFLKVSGTEESTPFLSGPAEVGPPPTTNATSTPFPTTKSSDSFWEKTYKKLLLDRLRYRGGKPRLKNSAYGF